MTMASNLRVWRLIPLLLCVVFFCPFAHGKVIYVDDDATGANDGTSWENAYNFLQDALSDAEAAGKPIEIHVAQGIYKPYHGSWEKATDSRASFQLINNVTIVGGYAGFGESDPNTRDIELYETILSGDLNGNDIEVNDPCDMLLAEFNRGDNSNTIIKGSNTNASAVLDGFTITGGYSTGISMGPLNGGAGMYIASGSPTIINCTFKGNATSQAGGGMYNIAGSPTLIDCKFENNYAEFGAGMYNTYTIYMPQRSKPVLINCSFIGNYSGREGGGIYNFKSDPNLTNCTFSHNFALACGAGIYNSYSNIELSDTLFIENSADSGGGMYSEDKSNLTLMNCTFRANSAEWSGGGMCNSDANDIILTSCIFNGNSVCRGSGGLGSNHNKLLMINCVLDGNKAYGGPLPYTYKGQGGGLYIFGDTEIIDGAFHNNWASEGAGIYIYSSNLALTGCAFSGNVADSCGGGVYNGRTWNYLNVSIANSTFSGNKAKFGGGVFNTWASRIGIDNSTFADNHAFLGNALACDPNHFSLNGYIELTNCIIWDNDNAIFDLDPNGFTFDIIYSDIKNGWEGEGNIDADPCFVDPGYWVDSDDPNIVAEPNDPNAVWVDGDYHLKSQAGRWDPVSESWVQDDVTSPCIDTGDPNSPIGYEPFPNGGVINMGAYGGTAEASKSPSGLHAKYGGGTGEPNNPYLIYTAEQMNTIGLYEEDWDKHFKLMADIDLSAYTGTDFNVIGYANIVRIGRDTQVEHIPFAGVFDGNGHKISNFSYAAIDTGTYQGGIGIFKIMSGENAQIKNLGLISPDISGQDNVGSLVGEIDSGTVSGCYAEGGSILADGYVVGGLVGKNEGVITNCTTSASVSGDYMTGGLVGYNTGTITDCHSSAIVLGKDDIGGLVGSDWNGTITRCSSSCSISGTGGYIGGLLGHNNYGTVTACYSSAGVSGTLHVGGLVGDNEGTISNCYSLGSVTGTYTYDTGGLVGFNWGSLGSTITDCYSAGSVFGKRDTGGLVGSNNGDKDTIRDCFWDIQTSEQSTSAGGTGKTTSEMQIESTFTDAGWDFAGESKNGTEDIWTFYEGVNYPRLAWEKEPIEPVAPSPYGGGTGTAANPYLIYTAEQLNMIGLLPHDWGRHFKLMADIDLSGFTGTDFNIIGYAQNFEDRNAFTGVFDGNGKTISNFSHTSTDRDYVALFAYIAGGNALIKNLGLIDPNINAGSVWSWRVASLVAINSGTISNCYVKGGTISGNEDVGGLVGDNFINGKITNCYSSTSISGNKDAGGLVGENSSGTIKYCYSTTGVSGGHNLGGLVGYNSGDVISSFWDIEASGQITSSGGTAKTTVEMQKANTFLEAGWDFVDETINGTEDIWWILEGQDYPRLWWEKYGGGTG